jgi:hypothetical protein
MVRMSRSRYIKAGLFALIFAGMLAFGSMAQPDALTPARAESSAFIDAGCLFDGYSLNCSSLGLGQRFGCMQIYNASTALRSLSPRLPVVECLFLSEDFHSQDDSEEGIIREGCMMPAYRRYIIKQGEEFILIRTKEEFLSIFAPVETKEEALAFAVALTSSSPRYDDSVPEGYFAVASSMEHPLNSAYLEETPEGFRVRLFDSEICGCGTHPYYAVDYLVTKAGDVTELSRQKVFDSTNQICVD